MPGCSLTGRDLGQSLWAIRASSVKLDTRLRLIGWDIGNLNCRLFVELMAEFRIIDPH